MIELTCLCGAVAMTLARRPDYINECNCSLCRKPGAWWGYFEPADLTVTGATAGYRRNDKAEPGVEVQFCANCGSTTHFVLSEIAVGKFGDTLRGANMRLAEQQDLAGIELRFPDGATWQGKGNFGFVRDACKIGDDGTNDAAVA